MFIRPDDAGRAGRDTRLAALHESGWHWAAHPGCQLPRRVLEGKQTILGRWKSGADGLEVVTDRAIKAWYRPLHCMGMTPSGGSHGNLHPTAPSNLRSSSLVRRRMRSDTSTLRAPSRGRPSNRSAARSPMNGSTSASFPLCGVADM